MNKTKIEWCDYTWNPVTGCMHGCEYCYAADIAHRFAMKEWECSNCINGPGCRGGKTYSDCPEPWFYIPYESRHVLDEPEYTFYPKKKKEPYPFEFEPTLYKYRLDEPQHVRKPSKIFVVSMGDLFGEWVPDEWIQQVFDACAKAPQHKYLFLTKKPGRFRDYGFTSSLGNFRDMWFGFSVTDQDMLNGAAMDARWLPGNMFVSIEPIHGPVNLKRICPYRVDAMLDFMDGGQYWLGGGDKNGRKLQWVIIGAETGNRKDKVIPKKEWVQRIVDDCRAADVPVFMKDSLCDLMGDDFIRDWPEGLR